MTYEQWVEAQIDKAFTAILTDNNFKRDFIRRLCDPEHQIKAWEEEVICRLMTLSSIKIQDFNFS